MSIDKYIETVMRECAESNNVTIDDMRKRTRKRNIIKARHETYYILRHTCPQISLGYMSEIVAKQNHATAIHGAKCISDRCSIYKNYAVIISAMIDRMQPLAPVDEKVIMASGLTDDEYFDSLRDKMQIEKISECVIFRNHKWHLITLSDKLNIRQIERL